MTSETTAREIRGAGLAALAARLTLTRRRRSPVEAPLEHTSAYMKLLFAVGFARLADPERATRYRDEARAILEVFLSDGVHAFLVAQLEDRIAQALLGRSLDRPLAAALAARLAALDRARRYHVDRMREASRILAPSPPDPIGDLARRAVAPIIELPERAGDPVRRAATLDAQLDAASTRIDGDAALAACLDALIDLPEDLAVAILARAIPMLEGRGRIDLHVTAIEAAARFGWAELVAIPLRAIRTVIRTTGEAPAAIVEPVLRALRRLELRPELIELLGDLDALPAGADALAIAGCRAFVGDARGWPRLDEAHAELRTSLRLTERIALNRRIANGYAFAPAELCVTGIDQLAAQFVDITDSFGTNAYLCVSVLAFVDSLVVGLVDLVPYGPASR